MRFEQVSDKGAPRSSKLRATSSLAWSSLTVLLRGKAAVRRDGARRSRLWAPAKRGRLRNRPRGARVYLLGGRRHRRRARMHVCRQRSYGESDALKAREALGTARRWRLRCATWAAGTMRVRNAPAARGAASKLGPSFSNAPSKLEKSQDDSELRREKPAMIQIAGDLGRTPGNDACISRL